MVMTQAGAQETSDVKPPASGLKERAKGALMFAPVVLLLIWWGGAPFIWMMGAAAAIGGFEWARMVLTGKDNVPKALFYVAAGAAALPVMVSGMMYSPLIAFWFLLALCFLLFAYNFSQSGPSAKLTIFGVIYIAFAISIMVWLRGAENGLYHFCTLLFIVWASDIAAYFTGRTLGGPKLAPVISPKKTWSGFFGSSVGAGLAAAGMASPWILDKLDIVGGTIGGMGWLGYFILGFILAMFGQMGDLFISIFKRHFGVKDTGALIPGHGGILDRIDALLLVALIFGSIKVVAG
jgi:phosphatidate cytidylyltransferase